MVTKQVALRPPPAHSRHADDAADECMHAHPMPLQRETMPGSGAKEVCRYSVARRNRAAMQTAAVGSPNEQGAALPLEVQRARCDACTI